MNGEYDFVLNHGDLHKIVPTGNSKDPVLVQIVSWSRSTRGFHIRSCVSIRHPAALDDYPWSIGDPKVPSHMFFRQHAPEGCLVLHCDPPIRHFT